MADPSVSYKVPPSIRVEATVTRTAAGRPLHAPDRTEVVVSIDAPEGYPAEPAHLEQWARGLVSQAARELRDAGFTDELTALDRSVDKAHQRLDDLNEVVGRVARVADVPPSMLATAEHQVIGHDADTVEFGPVRRVRDEPQA